MDQNRYAGSKLFVSSVIDPKDEIDEKLERSHSLVFSVTASLSEQEIHEALQSHCAKGGPQHEEVCHGLLFSILTDATAAQKAYRNLTLVSRDNLTIIIQRLNLLVYDKWTKLLDTPRQQIIWLVRELIRGSLAGADMICNSLQRQIVGGDISIKNVWLTESLLSIFSENRAWLLRNSNLMTIVVYNFLRLIGDHLEPRLHALRQMEVNFCIGILREKFEECMSIGRDLVRVLQHVARLPEIEKLWQDILYNPSSLCSTFSGLEQIMAIRTSRRYLISRLTPDMENKLTFLTSKVRYGHQKRYQEWFQNKYLSTPHSQSLRCDLIRYICAVIHPTNEVIGSDITQRWAIISWILTTCTSNTAASSAKLSLFYDWLFFNPEKDSIMNIEPCILVMFHSIRTHPAVTATLLDFMCRIMHQFHPSVCSQVRQGITSALRSILDKKVLPSLSPVLQNHKLDKELLAMIHESFSEFCEAMPERVEEKATEDEGNNHHDSSSEIGNFSDEDDDNIPLSQVKSILDESQKACRTPREPKINAIQLPSKLEGFLAPSSLCTVKVKLDEHLGKLEGQVRQLVLDLRKEQDEQEQCEILDQLIQLVIQEDLSRDYLSALAVCICQILVSPFTCTILPSEVDDESLEEKLGSPFYVVFRVLAQTPKEDPSRQPILNLLEVLYEQQARVGYHFLFFLKVNHVQDKFSQYKDFCNHIDVDLKTCLLKDLTLCQKEDIRLFTFLLPDVFRQFPNVAPGNVDLVHLIVSGIDANQLQELICQTMQGNLQLFDSSTFTAVLNASLSWETVEQIFLWQLIFVQGMDVMAMMPILPRLEFSVHAEALGSILIQLRQVEPTPSLLRPILCRESHKSDSFAVSILTYWAQGHEEYLADHFLALIREATGSGRRKHSKKVQHNISDKESPKVEQILAHLEDIRHCCNITFLMHESMQQALQLVQMNCEDAQKSRFSDLLALAEDIDDIKTTRELRRVPSRLAASAANKSTKSKRESESESGNSTEEEEIVPKQKVKKRRKVLDDDSD